MFKAELLERTAQVRSTNEDGLRDGARNLASCPSLVLNADYTPLSYYPLSLWPWQTAIKAIFLDRVVVIETYDREVHSPSLDMKIPSVIALKQYVRPSEFPAFTRFNLFLRDRFACQYCGDTHHLTFDHVLPRRLGGKTTWENIATACAPCNMKKGGRTPKQAGLHLYAQPIRPTHWQLQQHGKLFPPEPSARDVAGLALLGHRAGGLKEPPVGFRPNCGRSALLSGKPCGEQLLNDWLNSRSFRG